MNEDISIPSLLEYNSQVEVVSDEQNLSIEEIIEEAGMKDGWTVSKALVTRKRW